METPTNKKLLKELSAQLQKLQAELVIANHAAGIDDYITVKPKRSQSHFNRVIVEDGPDKAFGQFLLTLDITAKQATAYIPLSIASGIKPTGFMYQIEGSAAGTIKTTDIKCRGENVTQVTLGTMLYTKIPQGSTASFEIHATIRGRLGQTYKIVITRINYKLQLTDPRYHQYLKELPSDTVKLS